MCRWEFKDRNIKGKPIPAFPSEVLALANVFLIAVLQGPVYLHRTHTRLNPRRPALLYPCCAPFISLQIQVGSQDCHIFLALCLPPTTEEKHVG